MVSMTTPESLDDLARAVRDLIEVCEFMEGLLERIDPERSWVLSDASRCRTLVQARLDLLIAPGVSNEN